MVNVAALEIAGVTVAAVVPPGIYIEVGVFTVAFIVSMAFVVSMIPGRSGDGSGSEGDESRNANQHLVGELG